MRRILISAALSLCLLTSCAPPAQEFSSPPQVMSDASTADSAVEQTGTLPAGPLECVTSPLGMSFQAESDAGYYRFVTHPVSGGNLLYTDFASGTEIVLCTRPECEHSDDSCSAWFPFGYGELFLGAGGKTLYCVGDEGDGETLYRMELDGSGRRALYQCGLNRYLEGVVVSDGENLYTTVASVAGDVSDAAKTVVRIDGATGEGEELVSLAANEWLRGAFDGVLVLSRADSSLADWYALYSLSTGVETTVYSRGYDNSQTEGRLTYLESAQLYFFVQAGKGQANVLRFDMRTRRASTLCSNFPYFGAIWIEGIWDGKLRVSVSDTRKNDAALVEHMCYWIDCETGEVTENTLRYPWGLITQFVEVLAECGDSFFVQRGVEYTPIMLTGTDGTAYEITSETPVYAMIAKSDYFANNPAYRDIVPAALPGA